MTTPRLTAPQARVLRAMQAGAEIQHFCRTIVSPDWLARHWFRDGYPTFATLGALERRGFIVGTHEGPRTARIYSLTEAGRAWKDGEGCSQ